MDGLRILLTRGDEKLRLRFNRTELSIGSDPDADLSLPGAGIPRLAARLTDLGGGSFHLENPPIDRSLSQNLEVKKLGYGQPIRIGEFEISLQAPENSSPDRGPTARRRASERVPSQAELSMGVHNWRLEPGRRLSIGTASDNDLVLNDPFVSAHHCLLRWQPRQGWRLVDRASTNGTMVDGVEVHSALLPLRAKIRVGDTVLDFRQSAEIQPGSPPIRHGMVAASSAMHRVLDTIEGFARVSEPVMIVGASGTGKEGLARAIHHLSARAKQPWLAINCGALTEQLVEAELFGHVRGAFTGADQDKAGAFLAAHGGTLFLDEIGELPLSVQPKLLRVLESGTIRPVGGTKEFPVDVRIVGATHRDLYGLVKSGLFREDLFHRLFVLAVHVPPLRDRLEDIQALTHHFLADSEVGVDITPEGMECLLQHEWPGNARELRNVLVRSALLADGRTLDRSRLFFEQGILPARTEPPPGPPKNPRDVTADEIRSALVASGGNQARAARQLGLRRSTFHDKVRKLGLQRRL